MKKLLYILVPITICFIVGGISSSFQQESILFWYPTLIKAPLNPPNIVFPIAWSILYTMMGLSVGLVLHNKEKKDVPLLVALFILQLSLNFLWSILFFYLRNPLLGFVEILLLNVAIIYYTYKAYPNNKISALLMIPYVLWVSFATYLNLYILLYN